ncbi:LamG domain-containing protein, partial [Dactylosporangium sp. NPDC049742]|uniref:LamG domain-containing protein n=1 Tax=Dactylosporangium sp. NPDC049742 TaxID=3154737 RepID=UPI00341D1A6F
VTLNGAGGALKLTWPSKLPAPRIEGDTAVYESVLPDVDLQVQSTVEGFGYSLIVKSRQAAANPALAKLKFGLSSTGWSLRNRPGGGYEARDSAGKVTASAGQALMWDSAGVPSAQRSLTAGKQSALRHVPDNARKADLPTTVEGGSLVIVPDAAMLADPSVTYPVVIDPWTGVGRARWGYTNSTNANRDDGIVRVGVNTDGSGTYRSFFAFDLTWLPGKQIRGAKFITTMTHSWSCTATPVSLYRTGDLTTSGKQTWSGPALNLFVETKSGNAHKPSTGAGCTNDPQPNMYMEFSNQTLVNDIINFGQGRGSYTLGLSARDSDGTDESTGNRWKKFDQASTAMSIEYNTLPDTPAAAALSTHTDYTAAGQPCVTGATRPVLRSTTPWLKANISDPDGNNSGQLSASFALQQWNGTAWTAVAGWPKGDTGVPSGTLAEVQVPAGTPTGQMMRWQVQAADGLGGTSGWSPWCEFSLDTTPPGVVPTATTADGLYLESPPNDTMRGSVGRSGRFTFGANGETDIVDYEYQLDGGAKTYVNATGTGGPATVWVTPTHVGEHVLTVRSRDAAGNASPPKDYRFLVDSPSAPTAVWRMDEGAGTALATTPAGGPNATLSNGPAWTDGRVPGTHATTGTDRAVRFDGVDDLAATAGPVLDTSRSFGAAAWVRPTGGLDTTRTVLCQEGTAACGFAVTYAPTPVNRWTLTMYGADAANTTVTRAPSSAAPVLNQWTHLAVSWDAGTKTANLYVNGTLAASMARASNWNATGALLIGQGKENGSRTGRFLGDVAEVRVWDRVIDPRVDLNPLVTPVRSGAWSMADYDEDVPRQVTDDSGYLRPLTITDAPGTTWCDGYELGGGLCFDGVSGAATTGPVVRTDQSYTVSAWVRITDTSVSRAVLSQQGSRGAAFTVRYDQAVNRWSYAVTGTDADAPTVVKVTSLAAPVVNSWTYLEAVYDAQAGRIRLFVDGLLQREAPVPATWNAGGTFNVGRTQQAGTAAEFFAGDIDEVAAFTGAVHPAGTTSSPTAATYSQIDDDPAGTPSVKADFDADGKEDLAVFNDMGNGGLRLFVQYGGQTAMQQVWTAPTWGYPITSMRFVAGHLGYSPGSDIVGFLDYGNGQLGVWVWQGNNLGSPFHPIHAPTWNRPIANSRFAVGDYNADGYSDVALFTEVNNGHLRMHVIYGQQWNLGFQQVWDAPTWGYPITSLRIGAGHFGYSAGSDIAGFLDYGNGQLGVWVWQGDSLGAPIHPIQAPTWNRPITSSRFAVGDYNADGYTDIAVFTDGGSGQLRVHAVYGQQWNLGFQQVWDAPTWGYPITSLRIVAGHFGYSAGSDIAGFLDYGNGQLGVWVWQGSSLGAPIHPIQAPTWNRPIANSRLTTGDYNGDGTTDIAVFTDLTGGVLREHRIYGGQWNLGLQQVWDAPTWGYPSTSLRLVQ